MNKLLLVLLVLLSLVSNASTDLVPVRIAAIKQLGNFLRQPDGKLLLSGKFILDTRIDPEFKDTVENFIRMNSDLSVDAEFTKNYRKAFPKSEEFGPRLMRLLPSGQIVFWSGEFLVKLNPNGSLDSSFGDGGKAVVSKTNGDIFTDLNVVNGHPVLVGNFEDLLEQPTQGIVSLTPNAALDKIFSFPFARKPHTSPWRWETTLPVAGSQFLVAGAWTIKGEGTRSSPADECQLALFDASGSTAAPVATKCLYTSGSYWTHLLSLNTLAPNLYFAMGSSFPRDQFLIQIQANQVSAESVSPDYQFVKDAKGIGPTYSKTTQEGNQALWFTVTEEVCKAQPCTSQPWGQQSFRHTIVRLALTPNESKTPRTFLTKEYSWQDDKTGHYDTCRPMNIMPLPEGGALVSVGNISSETKVCPRIQKLDWEKGLQADYFDKALNLHLKEEADKAILEFQKAVEKKDLSRVLASLSDTLNYPLCGTNGNRAGFESDFRLDSAEQISHSPVWKFFHELSRISVSLAQEDASVSDTKAHVTWIKGNKGWKLENFNLPHPDCGMDEKKLDLSLEGQYHADESQAVDKEFWWSLTETTQASELKKVQLKVAQVEDQVTNTSDAKLITIMDRDKEGSSLLLFRGEGNWKAGKIDKASWFKEKCFGSTPKLGEEYQCEIKLPTGKTFKLKSKVVEMVAVEGESLVPKYLSKLEEGSVTQILTGSLSNLIWVGDLDRDGKLDFITSEAFHYNTVADLTLYLSSRAKKNQLFKKVGIFHAVGC